MHDLPFAIPESLASYVVQYETDPDKTIRRLKLQLQKRGPDAVGYFLLGWFYHRKELHDKAIDCALKAKTYAPGSPFFDKLHYFLKHPQLFKAWRYHSSHDSMAKHSSHSAARVGPILDLNNLIEKLSAIESRKLSPNKFKNTESGKNNSQNSTNVDDIASETLANIYEQQGKLDAAIHAYQRLKKSDENKEDHYSQEIERLKQLKKDQSEEE